MQTSKPKSENPCSKYNKKNQTIYAHCGQTTDIFVWIVPSKAVFIMFSYVYSCVPPIWKLHQNTARLFWSEGIYVELLQTDIKELVFDRWRLCGVLALGFKQSHISKLQLNFFGQCGVLLLNDFLCPHWKYFLLHPVSLGQEIIRNISNENRDSHTKISYGKIEQTSSMFLLQSVFLLWRYHFSYPGVTGTESERETFPVEL